MHLPPMTLEDRVCRGRHRRMQVDRLHELKPQLRKARADSQIATTLAVCELVFIALLNEIVQFSAGWCLHIQNSDQKSLRLCINRRRDLLALSANSRCLLTRSLFHGDRAALFLSLVMNSQRNQVQMRAGKRRAAFWRKQDFPNLKRAREQRLTQLERSRPYYPVGSKELIRRVKHGWMAAVFGLRDRRSMRRSRPRTTNAPRSIGACVL